MPKSRIFNVANMSFNAIRENKILAKISEFTSNLLICDYLPLSIGQSMFLHVKMLNMHPEPSSGPEP